MSTIHTTPVHLTPGDLALGVASIGDPDGTRTLTSIVALLVALGVALLLLAVWIHRTTRPDPDLLAPLEAMGERSWRRGDPVWQRRRLDELRPADAKPLTPSVAPPELDVAFDEGPTASGFDDLRTDTSGEAADDDRRDPTEPGTDAAGSEPDSDDPERDSTPHGVTGPLLEPFPDDDFDQTALAVASEELERELAESGGRQPAQHQLDLTWREPDA